MVSKRKCCAWECNNNYTTHSLFSFPKIDWTGFSGGNPLLHRGLRRCLYWIQKSGNVLLLKLQPEDLQYRYFMCSEHFDTDYFAGQNYRKLRSGALPNIFSHSGISDAEIQKYIAWVCASDRKSESSLSPKQRCASHGESRCAVLENNERLVRKCKVQSCGITSLSSTMFAFPRPSSISYHGPVINNPNYIRCKLWLQAVGNESLLAFSPLHLWRHAHICTAHFEDHHFHSKMRRKPRQTAVPSKLLPAPLSDDKMGQYNKFFDSGMEKMPSNMEPSLQKEFSPSDRAL